MQQLVDLYQNTTWQAVISYIVPACRRKRLTRFCGHYSEIPQPIRGLSPEFPMQSAEPSRSLSHIWPAFWTRPFRLPRLLKILIADACKYVWVSKRCRHCHVPCEELAPLPWDQCYTARTITFALSISAFIVIVIVNLHSAQPQSP